MKSLTIQAISSRAQEGYIDTKLGVALDIECTLSDVGSVIINLRNLETEVKDLFPPFIPFNCIEPDVRYRDGENCHIYFEASFSHIDNQYTSILHNLASLMSSVFAFKVSQLFRSLDFKIINDSNDEISDIFAATNVASEQFISFAYCISETLDIEFSEDDIPSFLSSLTDEDYSILSEELDGEFGFSDPIDRSIPFSEYNPFLISEKHSDFISSQCSRIQYDEIRSFFLENIKQ